MISLVLPCYNEEKNIEHIYSLLTSVMGDMGEEYEIVFVDDGSDDSSFSKMANLHEKDSHVRVVEFSRNFGHQAVICAGLDNARGDAVIMMDADLQHPPTLIPEMIKHWRRGFEIVYTVRRDPPGTPLLKRATAKFFYWFINLLTKNNIPANSADFRLLDRKVVTQLRNLPERIIFLRGLVTWMGFKRHALYYDAAPRFAGATKYSLVRMMRFAFDGITAFSSFPLHLATVFGFFVSLASFFYAFYALYIKLIAKEAIPGWTSVMVTLLFLGGVQLLGLGIIGEYLNRIYIETKGRPVYIVRKMLDSTENK